MQEILVITALREEMDAVLDLMPGGRGDWRQHKINEGYFYFECEIDNDGEPFRIKVTSQAQQGPTYATAHTMMMLKDRPDLLFMTGICAGNPSEGLKLGDVILSDMAFQYETGKHVEEGFKPEIECSNVDPVTVQWLKDFCAQKNGILEVDGTNRSLYIGPFATGSSVVSRKDIFTDLQKRERKVLALDMEAYNVLKAVEISNQKIPAIVIKGICDFADPDKNDKAHGIAARGAAVCTLDVAQHLLSNLPAKEPQAKSPTVTYPISLPRPANTYRDRLQWRALLKWPQSENWHFAWGKDFETGEYDELSDFSGLEFYELAKNKWLLEVIVGFGAYNGTFRYYFLDETRPEHRWKEVLFRSLYWSESKAIHETLSPEIDGNAWFDRKTRRIKTLFKGRGIGDIGHLITYDFEDGQTRLMGYRQKLDNDVGPDDENFYTDPEEWPELDIARNYPEWKGDIVNT